MVGNSICGKLLPDFSPINKSCYTETGKTSYQIQQVYAMFTSLV